MKPWGRVWRVQLGAGLFNDSEATPPSSFPGQRRRLRPAPKAADPASGPCHRVAGLGRAGAHSGAGGLEPRRWGAVASPGLARARQAGRAVKWLFQIRGPGCAVDTVISFNEKF